MAQQKYLRIPWRYWRRSSQLLFLGLFLWMFRLTELRLTPPSEHVNLWFRMDPLVAASAMLAARMFIATLLLSLIVLAVTALLGRVFCGWVCPMGTILDGAGKAVRIKARKDQPPRRRWRSMRYMLLILVLLGALFGFPLVGLFDPFALLMRGLAFAFDPLLNWLAAEGSGWLYLNASERVTDVSEPTYAFLKDHFLAFEVTAFAGAWISAGLIVAILLLERVEKRFWCRNLCPLGAMLGLTAKLSPLRRRPDQVCKGCQQCQNCRMDAFNRQGQFELDGCTLCMDCVDDCPNGVATFTFKRAKRKSASQPGPGVDLSRRGFVASCAAGLALPAVAVALPVVGSGKTGGRLLRPAGAAGGDDFMDLCVRCGECMKVCPTNGLQPVLLQAGLTGLFSPHLVPRIGYCEYNCTLCGDVCPTRAIQPLTQETKHRIVIGKAHFDLDRCLPYAEHEWCIVCEEHCPVPDKAIRARDVEVTGEDGQTMTVLQPEVVEELCIGCGICENVCPLEGAAGIRVTPV